jgi:sulfonate transport system substrate-binding protein
MTLILGVVPDIHFASLFLADKLGILEKSIAIKREEFASGTGELARALTQGTINAGIGLTDGLISAIVKGAADFQLIATFVDSPMKWMVLVNASSGFTSIEQLRGKTFGITKPGGGSHINTILFAHKNGWAADKDIAIRAQGTLESVIWGIQNHEIDAFVWEPFHIRSLVKEGKLRVVDQVIPPWSCFMVAARKHYIVGNTESLKRLLSTLQDAAKEFHRDKDRTIDLVAKEYNLSKEDASMWFDFVKYSQDGKILKKDIEAIISLLIDADVIPKDIHAPSVIAEGFAPIG